MGMLILYFAFILSLALIGIHVYRIYLGHIERFERQRLDARERISIMEMETAKAEADKARYTLMLNQPQPFIEKYTAGQLN